MRQYFVLDLFCGAGGASAGYDRSGMVEIVGVDINPQPHYPYQFVEADALAVLRGEYDNLKPEWFDFIHTSPPCQRYSKMTRRWGREGSHPDLVEPTRSLLKQLGKPYVIENVPGAPLINPVTLCGSSFGLGIKGTDWQLRRHRLFEASFDIPKTYCHHTGHAVGVYGNSGGSSKRDGLTFPKTDGWREAMEIDWMTGKELGESIPPVYTEYIFEVWLTLGRMAEW